MYVQITITAILKIWRQEIVEGTKTFTLPLPSNLAQHIAAAPSQMQLHLPQERIVHAVTLHHKSAQHMFVQITVSSVLSAWSNQQIEGSKVFVLTVPTDLAEQIVAAEAALQQHLPKEQVIYSVSLHHDNGTRVSDIPVSLD